MARKRKKKASRKKTRTSDILCATCEHFKIAGNIQLCEAGRWAANVNNKESVHEPVVFIKECDRYVQVEII